MSSTFNEHYQPKREPNDNSGTGVGIVSPPWLSQSLLLKLNKVSHVIKKPPSPSSSSVKPLQPVIIYTNTPKVIHTNPKDFMALVQKHTGMSRSDKNSSGSTVTDLGGKSINWSVSDLTVDRKAHRNRYGAGQNRSFSGGVAVNRKGIFFNNTTICEHNSESSSVITTDENIGEHTHVNWSLPYSPVAIPPPPPPQSIYDAATETNYLSKFSKILPANPDDSFVCGNQPFPNFHDPLYLAPWFF